MSGTSININPVEGTALQRRRMLIAGPCSAESENQVLDTARGLASLGKIDYFRCGIWKPRTRPGEFEGVGDQGLDWLLEVRQETGLPVMVEVATPYHVESCLRKGMNALWIGSRTIVNPFSIQEIANALEGTDIKILVKNPVNPDTGLWIGALERLMQKGITDLAAIHRGFSVHHPGPYRNAPLWQLPLEVKRHFPDLPMIADPSHICGRKDLLLPTARFALSLGFDGLMVESHIQPEMALTDRGQQITPEELGELLNNLELAPTSAKNQALESFREEIDQLDDELIAILARRMSVSEKIGALKKTLGMTSLDPARWEQVLRDRLRKAEIAGLDEDFIQSILETIHRESIRKQ